MKHICSLEIAKSMFQLKNISSSHHNHIFYLTAQTHIYMTRLSSKSNYFIPRKRAEYGKKSFSYVGPNVWQTVPDEIRVSSFNQFKRKIKSALFCQISSCQKKKKKKLFASMHLVACWWI